MLGRRVIRIDGHGKVTGRTRYGDDLQASGMLHAASRHTEIPAGRITRIDATRAKQMPGVVCIAFSRDIPGEPLLGPIRQDQHVIVSDEVFYSGDVVAVVAAETRALAQAAADAIVIDYEPHEPVSSIHQAILPETRLVHPEYGTNVIVHYPLRKGDVEKGFEEADQIIERTYTTGFHEHAYIEPESVLVEPSDDATHFTIRGCIQNPYTTRRMVARFLGLPLNSIVVKSSPIGGSFGGKDDQVSCLACRAALLAKMTERPVKLTLTREDSLRETYKRHPYHMMYKAGFTNDGRLTAMKINILVDGGAYSSMSYFVTWRSVVQATGPYSIPHVRTDISTVYTNNTYTAAFRGFGTPQIVFAQESLMDEIATLCHISPLQIRQLNGLKQDDTTASGQHLTEHTVSLREVMQRAADQTRFVEKVSELREKNKQSKRYKYGIGMACSYRGCSLGAEGTDHSCALMRVMADGSVTIGTAVHENGQGLATTMCMTAAEALGISMDCIQFMNSQTDTMPDGGPTVASRGTLVGGNAVIDAARQIKHALFECIKDELQVTHIDQTRWENNRISSTESNQSILFEEAAARADMMGVHLDVCGWFIAPEVSWDEESGQGNAYFTYVYGCQIAEIRVDTHTGKIEVTHITAAHDVGTAINLLGLQGQIYGGIAQGLGYGIFEDYNIQDSVVKSVNFDEYLIPTIKDLPPITPIIIENPDCHGPYGAKSIGEPTLELTAAAINNAYSCATNQFNHQLPLTLEQIFLGKNLRKPSRSSEATIECKRGGDGKNTPRLTAIESTSPKNLTEALDACAEPNAMLLAGGTDVMIHLRKEPSHTRLINIGSLPELHGIQCQTDCTKIAAMTPLIDILEHSKVQSRLPHLCEALSQIGSTQIRNRATLAGNIANAAPCADSVPPLLNYDAQLQLTSKKGARIIHLSEFILSNYKTILEPGEIITQIIVPHLPNKTFSHAHHKLGRRNAMNITRISAALLLHLDDTHTITDCRFSCGSLFNRPCRLPDIERVVTGKRLTASTIECIVPSLEALINETIGNRWSSEYKQPVFINMARDLFMQIHDNLSQGTA